METEPQSGEIVNPPPVPEGKQGHWAQVSRGLKPAWEWEFIEHKELPPLPEPRFVFDRDKLTIKIRDLGAQLDLSVVTGKDVDLRFLDGDGKEIQLPDDFLEKHGANLRDEIEDAAWSIFVNRKFQRAYARGEPLPEFDLWETLESGATLDWDLGVIVEPNAPNARRRVVPIFDLAVDEALTGELIQNRWLCRGQAALGTGPTGVGKSSLFTQLGISWCLNRPCFGFKPAGPISVLVVQAENDAGDLAEMRDGIVEGLGVDEEDEAYLNEVFALVTIDEETGHDFFRELKKHIRDWQPDLIIIDPLNAFVGGDLSKQDVAAEFLRHQLNPVLHRANIGAVIIHHTGKPRYQNGQQQELNPDYAGLGSSELSNWARAIVNLAVGQGNTFTLTLGKRAKRAGIFDNFGAPRVWLRHSPERIFWEQVDAPATATPKSAKTATDLLAMVPASPGRILKNTLLEQAKAAKFGEKASRAFLDELISTSNLYIHREKRPGTNPLQYVARHPQQQQPELTNAK